MIRVEQEHGQRSVLRFVHPPHGFLVRVSRFQQSPNHCPSTRRFSRTQPGFDLPRKTSFVRTYLLFQIRNSLLKREFFCHDVAPNMVRDHSRACQFDLLYIVRACSAPIPRENELPLLHRNKAVPIHPTGVSLPNYCGSAILIPGFQSNSSRENEDERHSPGHLMKTAPSSWRSGCL